jgi:hypothetical protein
VALPGMDDMDNAEFQPFLFVGALEGPNISDPENKLHSSAAFLRRAGLMKCNRAVA